MKILSTVSLGNNKKIETDLVSDTHFSPDQSISSIIDLFKEQKKSETLLFPGDVFQNNLGMNLHSQIKELLYELSIHYKNILFVPGNHDLRGEIGENKFEIFQYSDLPENVFSPSDYATPLEVTISGVNILLANLLFSGLFPVSELGITEEEELMAYKNIPDGKFLLEGDISFFNEMKEATKKSLHKDIDVLMTHVVTHPSLVKVIDPSQSINPLCQKIQQEEVIKKYNNYNLYLSQNKRDHISLEKFIWRYNIKARRMGLDLFTEDFSGYNNLQVVYGHTHTPVDKIIKISEEANIHFLSGIQPNIKRKF